MMLHFWIVLAFSAATDTPATMIANAPAIPLLEAADNYKIGVNDLLTLDFADLAGPGTQTVKTTRVSESGMISLPHIDRIKAQGLTAGELENAIRKAYRDAKIVGNVQVKAKVVEQRNK